MSQPERLSPKISQLIAEARSAGLTVEIVRSSCRIYFKDEQDAKIKGVAITLGNGGFREAVCIHDRSTAMGSLRQVRRMFRQLNFFSGIRDS